MCNNFNERGPQEKKRAAAIIAHDDYETRKMIVLHLQYLRRDILVTTTNGEFVSLSHDTCMRFAPDK